MSTTLPPPVPPIVPAPGGVPADYRSAGTMLFISGITTGLCALLCVFLLMFVCCIGIFWIPSLALAVITVISGWRAMQGERIANLRLINALALASSVLCGDLIGLVLNILALAWLSRFEVSAWIEGRAVPPQHG